jgi:hypothetical protein
MPFGLQMPYYVCKGECEKEIELRTRVIGTEYGVGCQVHIPTGPYVLDWIERVNGICSKVYRDVSRLVHKRQSNEWEALPEKVRGRLTSWLDWGDDERFLIYLPDSDFARKDDGLAGLALTDTRLVFPK